MISFKQSLYHINLIDNRKTNNNIDEIKKILINGDIDLIKKYTIMTLSDNESKLLLIKKILKSNIKVQTEKEIIELFNMINPLNNEWNMGSFVWNIKKKDEYLYIQNSILKINKCPLLYENYINLIKKILNNSDIDYEYKEFNNLRFKKSIDLVFKIKIN